MAKDYTPTLEALFATAVGPERRITRADAIAAGIPARFADNVRHRAVRVLTDDDAKTAAKDLAQVIATHEAETETLDPRKLADQLRR